MAITRGVRELRQIPFGALIGGPMKAAIEAQALAAKTTIEFIQKVGFKPANDEADPFFGTGDTALESSDFGDTRTVTFKYTKADENGIESDMSLTVPVLSIVPIPSLRIDEMTIDFTAKINDVIENSSKDNFKTDTSLGVKHKSFFSPVSVDFRTSMSYDRTTTSSAKYTREYTMAIHVRAVQDELPAGLGKILNILEQAILDKKAAP